MNSTPLFTLLVVAILAMMSGSADAQVRGRIRKAVDNKYADLPSQVSAADMEKIKARYLAKDEEDEAMEEEEEDNKKDKMEEEEEEDDEEDAEVDEEEDMSMSM